MVEAPGGHAMLWTLGQLRARPGTRDLPVVMMSAAAHPDRVDPRIAGFVRKPFDLDHLLGLVARLIGPGEPTRDP